MAVACAASLRRAPASAAGPAQRAVTQQVLLPPPPPAAARPPTAARTPAQRTHRQRLPPCRITNTSEEVYRAVGKKVPDGSPDEEMLLPELQVRSSPLRSAALAALPLPHVLSCNDAVRRVTRPGAQP